MYTPQFHACLSDCVCHRQISVGTTYDELLPGLKLNLTTTIPDSVNFGKTQIQYQHDFAAVSTTLQGFKSKPSVEFSTNVGNDKVSLGTSFVYDTQTRALTALTAGKRAQPLNPPMD